MDYEINPKERDTSKPKKRYVGHYGCGKSDRVIKVAARMEPGSYLGKRLMIRKCPGCGEEHRGVKPMWRLATDADWRKADRILR